MGVFKSTKQFPTRLADLQPVATDVEAHFRERQYEVASEPTIIGGWHIDIHKGGLFKAALGMKTSLKIEIEPNDGGTLAKAGVGIFGAQAVPTALMLFVTWPVLITQIWGMVKQAHLDDEALAVIGESLEKHGMVAAGRLLAAEAGSERKFCTNCGYLVPGAPKLCPECGTQAR